MNTEHKKIQFLSLMILIVILGALSSPGFAANAWIQEEHTTTRLGSVGMKNIMNRYYM